MSKDSLRNVIAAVNTGKRFPAIPLVRSDPGLAAVISKMVPDREMPRYNNQGNREAPLPNIGLFNATSDRIAQNATDGKTVMQLLPDMELSAQILVSSILSPKDMMSPELTYGINEGLMAPDVSAAMLDVTKKFFDHDYKIKPLLPKMLRDMLFETGSYAIAVIPENSIDDAINGSARMSFEDLKDHINQDDGSVRSLGLLGPAVKDTPTEQRKSAGLVMESLNEQSGMRDVDGTVTFEGIMKQKVETFLSVTDNHTLLKIPEINQKIREQRVISSIGSKAMESLVQPPKMNDRQMSSMLYKDRPYNYQPITKLKTQDQLNRRTVGNPLVLHLPSESVIPVFVPGCPEQQIGFFVLIDADGHPVSKVDNVDHYQQLSQRLNSQGSFPSAMLNRVKGMMDGFDATNREHLDFSARAYGSMVEQDLLARLRNGAYGNGVKLGKQEEVYRIMFARALAKQHTQLLFIPVELMTYFAFKYSNDGIGQSLLEDMKILNSLRTMLMFANVMASLKNSIGRTEVKLKLDESDPDPKKTIETAMDEIIRSRQQYFPLGMNNPSDLTNWLQRSGFEFTFEGHPGLPDVGVDFGEKNSNYIKPDTELEESLRKRAIMATGLPPETVDAGFNAEFATSIVTQNILLAKRVMQMQEQFTPQLTDHHRKFMLNSEELQSRLREVLINNYAKLNQEKTDAARDKETDKTNQSIGIEEFSIGAEEVGKVVNGADEITKQRIIKQFMTSFIMNFEVSLPSPNSITLENQMAAMKTYSEALDVTIDAYISDKFFTNTTGGEVAAEVTTIKEVLKAYFLRQWMAENGVMTELAKLTTVDAAGLPAVNIFEQQKTHIEGLTKGLTHFLTGLQPIKKASDKVIDAMGGVDGSPDTGSTDSGTGDDGFGDGAMDFGMDIPSSETSPDAAPAELPEPDAVDTETPPETTDEPKEEEAPAPESDEDKDAKQ